MMTSPQEITSPQFSFIFFIPICKSVLFPVSIGVLILGSGKNRYFLMCLINSDGTVELFTEPCCCSLFDVVGARLIMVYIGGQ